MQYTLPGIICVIHLFTDSEKSPDRISTKQCFLYDTRQYLLISMYNRIYLPPEEAGFFLSQDLIIGMVTCGLASISVKRHTVIILSLSPVLLYLGIGLYTSSGLYLIEFSQPDGSLYFSSGNARQVTGNIAKHAPAKKKDDFRTKAMGSFQRPAPSTQQQRNTILLPDIGEQNNRRDS